MIAQKSHAALEDYEIDCCLNKISFPALGGFDFRQMSIFQMGLGFPKQTNLRNFHWLLFFFFFPRSVCILSLFSSLFYCFLTFNSQFFFYFSFISLLVKFLSFSFLTLYLSLLTLSDIFFDKTCHLPIFISLFPKKKLLYL